MSTKAFDPTSFEDLSPEQEAELRAQDPSYARSLRVSSFVDGELDDEAAEAFERELLDDPELQAELEEMVVLSALALEAAPVSESRPDTTEAVPSSPLSPRLGDTSPAAASDPDPEKLAATSPAVIPLRSRRWLDRLSAGAVTAAAAAAVIVATAPPDLDVTLVAPEDVEYRSVAKADVGTLQAVPGTRLDLAIPRRAGTFVRVYPPGDGSQVITCPGDAACRTTWRTVTLQLELVQRGTWEILQVTGQTSPHPSSGSLDGDLERIDAQSPIATRKILVK